MNTVIKKPQRARSLALSLVLLGTPLFCIAPVCMAEVVAIPLGQQGQAWQIKTPATGTTKSSVEAKFGSPMSTSGPVGEPPISIWEYEKFSVYFEYDHVIHTVVKHNAADS